MKNLPIVFFAMAIALFASCSSENGTWEEYAKWRQDNEAWYNQQAARTNPDGTPYYTKLSPAWNPSSGVLVHYFNDRNLTKDNLSPMVTSTTDVVYIGRMYNDIAFDSSYLRPDSVYQSQVGVNLTGWQVAMLDMHVGDTCEIIIPWIEAYGATGNGSIPAFSTLKFNVKLKGIPYYEVPAD